MVAWLRANSTFFAASAPGSAEGLGSGSYPDRGLSPLAGPSLQKGPAIGRRTPYFRRFFIFFRVTVRGKQNSLAFSAWPDR